MIDLKEEIRLMGADGDATLILSLYQLEEIDSRIEELEAENTELTEYVLSTEHMNTFEVLNSLVMLVGELKERAGIKEDNHD